MNVMFVIALLRIKKTFDEARSVVASLPFEHIAIDLCGPFITTPDGNQYVLLIVDVYTRFVVMWPIKHKTGQEVAQCLLTTFSLFGFPCIIQSDNGGEFVNSTIQELKTICAFDHRLITPYYPQSNGIAEAQVKTLKSVLFKSILGQSDQWDHALQYVQYSMNCKVHPSHQLTPFMAMFGRKPFPLIDHRDPLQDNLQKRFEDINQVLFPLIRRANTQSAKKRSAKLNTRPQATFKSGDIVMVKEDKLTATGTAPWYGPFKIVRRNKGGAYILQDTTGEIFHRNTTASEMKLSKVPFAINHSVIKSILDHRQTPTGLFEYHVLWANGYETWEPANHFDDNQVLFAYHRKA